MNLNKVMITGRLTREVELRRTAKGTALAEIGLAVNRVFTDEQNVRRQETTFVDIILRGRTAEVAAQYLRKGSPVFIEGRLQLDTWDDKQTGQKRSRLRVVGENLQLLGFRDDAGVPTPGTAPSRQTPERPGVPEPDFDDTPF